MKEQINLIRSFYSCPECDTQWEDVWDCACDDSCPECHASDISPYEFRDEPDYDIEEDSRMN